MRVLLLGASGYLGSSLYDKLKKYYDDLIGTSFQKKVDELYQIDINDSEQVKALLEEYTPDTIIWSLMSGVEEDKLTKKGLDNVLKTMPETTRFIYISSDSVFAGGKGNYSEEATTQYLNISNPLHIYANAKIDAEEMVKKHVNHLIIRVGPIYGRNSNHLWDNRLGLLIENLPKGNRLKRADNLYKTFVHIDDVVDGVVEMLNKQMQGIIHLGPLQKESYYSFNIKQAKKLGLDDSLIEADYITQEEARERWIPLDTSLNTAKCSQLLSTKFNMA